MTQPGGSTELAAVYVGVVPSLAHIHDSVATGAREAAKVFSTAFQAESVTTMAAASANIAEAFSTAIRPQMERAGHESGIAYGTGLSHGIRDSQTQVTASLAAIDTAFRANRQSILDVTAAEANLSTVRRAGGAGETAAAETALLAARRESTRRLQDLKSAEVMHAKAVEEDGKATATATGHVGRLGTALANLKTHFTSSSAGSEFTTTLKGMGDAAKATGGAITGVAESAVGMATKMAGAALSPLGLGVALLGASASAIELTKHLIEIGDTYEAVERIMATQSAAVGEQLEGLDGIVGSVASKTSASIESIASTVARLSSLTRGLSGGDLNTLTTDISDLQVMLGHPINTEQLVGAAHALGVEDDKLDDFVNRLFNVSRATGVSMDELTEQVRKNGFALKEMNIPADVAVGLFAQMDAQGIPTAGMMRAFGVTAKQAGKDQVGFNDELVKQIKHLEDLDRAYGHAAAQDYAAKTFGARGALSVMAAFDAGILSSASLATAMKAPTQSIQQTFDATKNLGDQFGILKNVISTALAPLGVAISHSVGGGLAGISDWLKTHGETLVQFFSNAAGAAIEAGQGILHAFAPIMEMVGKMIVAYGNVFNDDVSKQAGLDMENYGKSITGPDGPIAGLEKLRHEKDQYFNELRQQVGVGQLFDDALEPSGDKGLHPKTDTHSQDDINRLKGLGVTVGGDQNNLTIKTNIKTDLPPDEKAKVEKEISDLVKDGVKVTRGKDGEITLNADTKDNKQHITDFIRDQAGRNLKIPVEMLPHLGPLPPGAAGAPAPDSRHHTTQGAPADGPHKDAQGHTVLPSGPGTGGSNDVLPPPSEWIPDLLKLLRGNLGGGIPGGGTVHVPGHPDLHYSGETGGFLPATGGAIPILAHEGEWIAPKWMAKAFGPALEATRLRGYDQGGSVGPNIFGIPLPNPDPNAPGAPPGGWSTKTQQHDQAWQDAQTAAQRGVEHASDRVEDLGDNIAQYRDALATATAALNDPTNTPAETAAAQKEYNKALRELTRATRDLGEAKQDLTTEQRKQVEIRDKPPESSGKGSGDIGQDLVKNVLKGMGFPDVFGASVFDWGIWKTAMAGLQDLMALLTHHHTGSGSGTGSGESVTMPKIALPTDQQRGGIVIGGGTAQYGTGTTQHGPGAASGGGQGQQGGGQPAITAPWGQDPHAATAGYYSTGDGSQVQTASAIYNAVTDAGYSPATATTAVAAAQFESGLNPDITNATGHHGLFQESADKPSADAGQQISWLLNTMNSLGGPAAFAADPARTFADRVEVGGYSGSRYDIPGAAALLGGAAGGGSAGFGGGVPSVPSTEFSMPGGGFTPQPYGLPKGTDIRQGAGGFPPWVYAMGAAYGLQPSTYAGHQEGSGQNRGIDWFPTGHADMSGASYSPAETQRLQSFAAALQQQMPGMDPAGQVIFSNLQTGQDTGVAHGAPVGPGTSDPGYYRNDWKDHHGHVHTSFSMSEPVPGGQINQMITPGQQSGGLPGPSGEPPQPSRPAGQSGGSGTTLTSSAVGGDLGLPASFTSDPLNYLWQTDYHYKHGDAGVFDLGMSLASVLPGVGDKLKHPLRGGVLGAAAGAAPPPVAAPDPPSAITSSMATRSPNLEHVSGPSQPNVQTTNYHFEGITTPQKIAPAILDTHMRQTRATIPRST